MLCFRGGPARRTPMRSRHLILLVDDDVEVRLGVADLLQDLGLEVRHAESGLEALDVVRSELVHAAVLDMYMPGCTGFEALPLLHRERADLPCIVYSGRWTLDLEQAVIEAGALACLKKPVEPDALRREVRRALGLDPLGTRGGLN